MKNFVVDTKDPVEILFKTDILKNFPNYAMFWNKFIGISSTKGFIKPYRLSYPTSYTDSEKKILRKKFNLLTMHNYSLFINLAGAHKELKSIINSNLVKDEYEKYFNHWDSFDNFYIKLGNVFNQLMALWNISLDMNGKILSRAGGLSGLENSLYNLMSTYRKKSLWYRYVKMNNIIKLIRNSIVHHSRLAGSYMQGIGFFLPYRKKIPTSPIRKREPMLWTEQVKTKKFINTVKKAQRDLKNTEEIVNLLYEILINEIDDFLITNNVSVNY